MNKSGTSQERIRNKFGTSHKNIVNKFRTSHLHVRNKSLTSNKQFMNKSYSLVNKSLRSCKIHQYWKMTTNNCKKVLNKSLTRSEQAKNT